MRELEIDQTCYPFGDLRIGDNWYLAKITTLSKVFEKPLPLPVIQRVAKRLNELYYGEQKDALERTILNPLPLIVDEAAAARTLGAISTDRYRELLTNLGA